MAATITTLFYLCSLSNSLSPLDYHSKLTEPMLFLFFITLSLLALLFFSLQRTLLKKTEQQQQTSNSSNFVNNKTSSQTNESKLTQLTHSLLLEILPSDSPKWATLFGSDDPDPVQLGLDGEEDCVQKRKKKKRAKKKKPNLAAKDGGGEGRREEGLGVKEKQELVCLYPFTSSSSATQRKIKHQYDQLVKSNESNGLTLDQVGQFVNCLVEARNELQHKSEVIQRKFTITKTLLLKADRSSFDRIRQQIYKLELEQKRLEEDAFVYNWLQQQLKLSPAYKKMLEIGAAMEFKAKTSELTESAADAEFEDISFEELLAQEKKDSFWQKNGKPRTCSG